MIEDVNYWRVNLKEIDYTQSFRYIVARIDKWYKANDEYQTFDEITKEEYISLSESIKNEVEVNLRELYDGFIKAGYSTRTKTYKLRFTNIVDAFEVAHKVMDFSKVFNNYYVIETAKVSAILLKRKTEEIVEKTTYSN